MQYKRLLVTERKKNAVPRGQMLVFFSFLLGADE